MIFPKQHIIFEPYLPNECFCNTNNFRLAARLEDVCQFQVKVAPCEGTENSLCNPNFSASEYSCNNWITEGGWVLDDNACIEDSTGDLKQFGSLVIGNIYQCEINVSSILGTLYIYNGLTEIAQIQNSGTTIFTFTATTQDVMLSILDSNHSVCITSFSARPLSNNLAFGIINSNGTTLNVFDIFNSPDYFTFTKDRLTVKFRWSDFGVEEGQCYTIGVADGCTNINGQFGIFNEGFDNCLSGWALNVGTLTTLTCEQLENPVSGDVENCIEFTTASGIGNIQSYATDLKVGLFYIITIDAISTDADGFLRIYTGTTYYDFTTSGEQNIQLCTDTPVFKIEAHLQTSTYIRLWGFTLRISNVLDFEFDYESYPFKIDQNACTHVVGLSNDDNGLGLVFEGSNFAPQLRLESVIHNTVPETIRKTYHDNLGKKDVYYGEFREAVILDIDYVPAWVFRFLCMCFIADHFFVDGVEYFIEGENPEPQYPENVCYDNMTPYKMTISEKVQLCRNADLGNEENLISYTAQQVLTDNNGNQIIELFTGQAIDVPL